MDLLSVSLGEVFLFQQKTLRLILGEGKTSPRGLRVKSSLVHTSDKIIWPLILSFLLFELKTNGFRKLNTLSKILISFPLW